jgi:chemotaxis response regulator CheB
MPTSAVEHVRADHILPLSDIARQLTLIVSVERRASARSAKAG